MIEPIHALRIAQDTLSQCDAEQVEVMVSLADNRITRFESNSTVEHARHTDVYVSVRAVRGKAVGVSVGSSLDAASLRKCGQAACTEARDANADPFFDSLPAPDELSPSERACESVVTFPDAHRSEAVDEIVGRSASRGLVAAGFLRMSHRVVAVASSLGVAARGSITGLECRVRSVGQAGSGWSALLARDAECFSPLAIGEAAAASAIRSGHPRTIEPGQYTTVFGPQAVGDLLQYLSWFGFSGRSFERGESFLSGRLEYQVFNQPVSITDNALSDHALGMTFDFEGTPKMVVPIIEYGVGIRPVTDSYWANRGGWVNSGHALPAPNAHGPQALDLEMAAGDATADELIASVQRGIYVTRLRDIRLLDPRSMTLSGNTCDGTYLIENGAVTHPIHDLHFSQSLVDALYDCDAVSSERSLVGHLESAMLVPSLLCEHFDFTHQAG